MLHGGEQGAQYSRDRRSGSLRAFSYTSSPSGVTVNRVHSHRLAAGPLPLPEATGSIAAIVGVTSTDG